MLIIKKKTQESLPLLIADIPRPNSYRKNQIQAPNLTTPQMAEHPSTENYTRKSTSKQSSTRRSVLNAYLIFASLCALTALIISSISLHRANEALSFKSSIFIADLDRTFNSTVYAIADPGHGGFSPDCSNLTAETVTGQTSIPGQCVTVTDSYNLWVTRLAKNCVPYVYAEANCTGTSRGVTDYNFTRGMPACVVAAGAGDLKGDENSTYNSFQILCT